ncbi:MAG TPA: CehA/McbA family metallohydrolase [Humisphaera sp.]
MRRTARRLLALAAVLALAPATAQAAKIVRLDKDNWDLVPGGKEVDAIYGDYVLKNDKVVAVVAAAVPNRHANLQTTNVQGAVIDFALLSSNNDQLTAYQPHAFAGVPAKPEAGPKDGAYNNPGPAADRIDIVKADGDTVVLRATRRPTDDYPVEIVTEYTLADGAQFLKVVSTWTNTADKPVTVRTTERLKCEKPHTQLPAGKHQLVWHGDRYFGAAYGLGQVASSVGLIVPPTPANAKGAAGLVDSPDWLTGKGPGATEIKPRERLIRSRVLAVGLDAAEVQSVAKGAGVQIPAVGVRFVVLDETDKPLAGAHVLAYPAAAWAAATPAARHALVPSTYAVTDASGAVLLPLPPGEAVVVTDVPGRLPTEARVSTADAERTAEARELPLKVGPASRVSFSVTDGDGADSPVKVQFLGLGTTPNPDLGPDQRADGCRNLWYSVTGKFDVPLPPGDYAVILSRGPEFDTVWRTVKLTEGKTARVSARLPRVVDTKGWISTDFHNHSTISGDNSTSTEGRLATLIAEGVEFAPATEHQRIISYRPYLKAMHAEHLMGTSDGMELTGTPLPLDHQNAFPLHAHPHVQYGGGPEVAKEPAEQMKRLRDADGGADKLVQQNHPDLGWLVCDRDGDGKPDAGFGTLQYTDVMEIFETAAALSLKPTNERTGVTTNNRFFNWLQLLNQGHRIPGAANTDAHICFHESGKIRNWVMSPTDDPAAVKEMDVVKAARQGRMIMSSGPFLQVTLNGAVPGDDLKLNGAPAELKVRVQCPNWFSIDRVQVLVNGRAEPALNFTRKSHPKLFGDGVVKFDQAIPLQLKSDAHVIVIAADEHGATGPVMGTGDLPVAISNPIWVDVDGDGFKPNKDTLGHPLPVKLQPKAN